MRYLILLLVVCLGSTFLAKAEILVLTEGDKNKVVESEFLLLAKHNENQDLQHVKKQSAWFVNDGLYYFTGDEGNLWGKFTVRNTTNSYWLAEFTDHRTDEIVFYYPNGDSSLTGDQQPFSSRKFQHKNFAFKLLNSTDPVTYYFRINSENRTGVRVLLKRIDWFVAYGLNEYLYLGLFYGVLFVIAALNLLTFLKVKLLRYLFYSGQVVALGLFSACQDGLFYQYLWPFKANSNHAFEYFMYLYVVFELLYTLAFFNLKKHAPKLFKVILGLIILRTIYLFFALFFGFYDVPVGLDSVHLLFVFGIGCYMFFKRKYPPAKYFVVGFAFMLLGYFVYSLVYMGLISISVFTVYAFQIGAVVEFLVLTLAFADQVRYHRQRRIDAQEKMIANLEEINSRQININNELEVKVAERTEQILEQNKELKTKNIELENLQQRLWEMNSEMDKLNWRLSKDIEEKNKKHVDGALVTFEEFRKIYPSEKSVFKLLHNLKIEKGFQCKSCKNKKCKTDESNFLRICTQCGYRESASANTLLHGVRINKTVALYLIYRFFLTPKESTKLLSEELNVKAPSVYLIRKKVFEVSDGSIKKEWITQLCN